MVEKGKLDGQIFFQDEKKSCKIFSFPPPLPQLKSKTVKDKTVNKSKYSNVYVKYVVRLKIYLLSFVETPRKFITIHSNNNF